MLSVGKISMLCTRVFHVGQIIMFQTVSCDMAMCSECNTGQKLAVGKVTAKLVIRSANSAVCAYTESLNAIIGDDIITMEKLLLAPMFDMEYDIGG